MKNKKIIIPAVTLFIVSMVIISITLGTRALGNSLTIECQKTTLAKNESTTCILKGYAAESISGLSATISATNGLTVSNITDISNSGWGMIFKEGNQIDAVTTDEFINEFEVVTFTLTAGTQTGNLKVKAEEITFAANANGNSVSVSDAETSITVEEPKPSSSSSSKPSSSSSSSKPASSSNSNKPSSSSISPSSSSAKPSSSSVEIGTISYKESSYTCVVGESITTTIRVSQGLSKASITSHTSSDTTVAAFVATDIQVNCSDCIAVKIDCKKEGTATLSATSSTGATTQSTITVRSTSTPSKPETSSTPKSSDIKENPDTGNSLMYVILGIGLLMIGYSAWYFKKQNETK